MGCLVRYRVTNPEALRSMSPWPSHRVWLLLPGLVTQRASSGPSSGPSSTVDISPLPLPHSLICSARTLAQTRGFHLAANESSGKVFEGADPPASLPRLLTSPACRGLGAGAFSKFPRNDREPPEQRAAALAKLDPFQL